MTEQYSGDEVASGAEERENRVAVRCVRRRVYKSVDGCPGRSDSALRDPTMRVGCGRSRGK